MSGQDSVPLGQHARAYAERGWAVLPIWPPAPHGRCACGRSDCGDEGKHPIGHLVPKGLLQATSAPKWVDAWWSVHPDANVGIRTGAGSSLVVLDVDGKEGTRSLRELVERHGAFDALWARTGSGGWHAYLAHPGGEVPNSAGRIGPGLDVRGDGGYVVAPPSLHPSGRRYRWADAPESAVGLPSLEVPPPMPDWLIEAANPPAREQVTDQPIRLRPGGMSAYAAAAVAGEAHEVAHTPPGQRNHRLNVAAYKLGRLVGAGILDEASATTALLDAGLAAGPGERKIRSTVQRGLEAGMRNPRHVEPAAGERAQEHAQEAEAC